MLGAILGDIIGSRWEFNPTNDYDFELFSDKNGFTDDTVCTIGVADALLNNSVDFGKYIHKWCRKYPNPMGGYGGNFAIWVASDNPQPYNSLGNGSAMRVSPVAYFFDTVDEVLDAAEKQASCSHNHLEGIKGAQTVALAMKLALDYNRHGYQNAIYHIDDILNECVKFSGYDINMPKSSVLNKFDETCMGTAPVALKIISMARSYEDAVRMAVSLGVDADTLGAIVGGIAETIWGMPNEFRHKVMNFVPEDMQEVIERFLSQHHYNKNLIDTTFSSTSYREVAWDLLDEDEVPDLQKMVDNNKRDKRSLMEQRAKARIKW